MARIVSRSMVAVVWADSAVFALSEFGVKVPPTEGPGPLRLDRSARRARLAGGEVGVHPAGAVAAGQAAQQAADSFATIPAAFDGAVAACQAASVEAPLSGAFAAFAELHRQTLVNVAQQAQAVGSSSIAGAAAATATDQESARGFANVIGIAGVMNFGTAP